MQIITRTLARTYGQLAQWRVLLYERGVLKKKRLGVPVISLGNLTFGGTGKTPLSLFLLDLLQSKGHRPALAAKSYKALSQQIQKINSSTDKASQVGDEAFLVSKRFPEIPVYSGPVKAQVAEAISKNEKIDLILVDDGFQHLALARDLDILLMDASEDPRSYECFPSGRARENLQALSRAQLVFLTKCNLASEEKLDYHRRILKGKDVFEFDYALGKLADLQENRQEDKSFFKDKKIVLLSALAKPESFANLVKDNFPGNVQAELLWPDHHAYTERDLKKLYELGPETVIFTTEKDAVKLRALPGAHELPLWQVRLEIKPRFQVESLYAKIHSFLA